MKRNAKALIALFGGLVATIAPYAAVLPADSRAAHIWSTVLGVATALGVWAAPNKP